MATALARDIRLRGPPPPGGQSSLFLTLWFSLAMCSLEIRKLTSCVGYAMRTASRLQMSEVKEHLVIALTLLRSDKCGQNVEDIKTGSKPLLSPVVVAPTVPLQNSEAKAFANDFPATILHAVELSCNGMINNTATRWSLGSRRRKVL